MHSLLELKSVSKSFGGMPALIDVDLGICPQRNLVLVGPSGAGKSTLLRLVAGLEEPDTGSIARGKGIDGSDKTARAMTMLSQDYALYPQQTVTQNLQTSLRNLKLSKGEVTERLTEALDWFGIRSLADRLPSELSGGEAQRAAFAKALVARPKLLLLDEPLSQVDTVRKEALLEMILQSIKKFELSSLIVTHDPVEALRLGDDIAVIEKGRIVQKGEASDVYRKPICRIAGNLLSPFGMNWFDAEQWSSVFHGSSEASQPQSKSKYFGFRPESIRLKGNSPDGSLNFTAKLQSVEELGFARLAKLRLGSAVLNALVDSSSPLEVDADLVAAVAVEDICFVDH